MNMTFNIRQISIPIFIGFLLVVTTTGPAYDFVKCPDDNNTYPEGTVCEFTDDNLEEGEEKEDEQEHEEESDEQE